MATSLRELLKSPKRLASAGVYDCLSARAVELAGLDVASVSGAAVTASRLGYPDVGLQTFPEVVATVARIAESIAIPVVVDADTGYGNALNAVRAAHAFEAAGLAGMMVEDQTFPKRCGHFEGKSVVPRDEMVAKISALCAGRRSDEFIIVGRTDARAVNGLEDAIERACLYVEAGADMIFVESLLSADEMREVCRRIPAAVRANMGEGGKTPMIAMGDLFEYGFKLVNYSGTLQRTGIRSMQKALRNLDVATREAVDFSIDQILSGPAWQGITAAASAASVGPGRTAA